MPGRLSMTLSGLPEGLYIVTVGPSCGEARCPSGGRVVIGLAAPGFIDPRGARR